MNKIALIVVILTYSIFAADTLYLRNGKEIKDASIVKIGVSEVEYKVGKKDVLYTVKKSDIAIIFFADGTKEVFEADKVGEHNAVGIGGQTQGMQNVQNTVIVGGATVPAVATATVEQNRYENFSTGQRWGTWGLNFFLPGVGSLLIMNDWTGAITQWVLFFGGYALMLTETRSYDDESPVLGLVGAVMVVSDLVYNIYRSASYDKPHSVAYSRHDGFNFAVIPNRRGNLIPAVTYNKTF